MAKGKKHIAAEEFVIIWQSSRTLDEVLRQTGLARGSATARASKYRRMGVPLKRMHSGSQKYTQEKWSSLAGLARRVQKRHVA